MPVLPRLKVEQALYHQCKGGTNTVPPLVMEMQTGSTSNHISQIFFVLAAPVLMVRYKEDCHVCSTNTNRQIDD